MIIYADILFIVNFIMDFMSLYVCAKVLNIKIRSLTFCFASLIGGIYGISGFFFSLPEPFTATAVSLLMCLIAFGKRKISSYLKAVMLFYTTGMLFGGIMTFLYNTAYKYKNALLFKGGLKTWMFFVLTGIMLIITLFAGRLFSSYMYRKSINAEIYFGKISKKASLLCDTGNLLRDPYSNLPVIVLRAECLDSIFGKAGIHRYPDKADCNDAVKYKLRYIPVKTAAGSTLMPAISADKIMLSDSKSKSVEVQAIIASDCVSGSCYGGNDGIIPYTLAFNF